MRYADILNVRSEHSRRTEGRCSDADSNAVKKEQLRQAHITKQQLSITESCFFVTVTIFSAKVARCEAALFRLAASALASVFVTVLIPIAVAKTVLVIRFKSFLNFISTFSFLI